MPPKGFKFEKKPEIRFTSVYANIAWRVTDEGGEVTRCATYLTYAEQSTEKAAWEAEGWSVREQLCLFARVAE